MYDNRVVIVVHLLALISNLDLFKSEIISPLPIYVLQDNIDNISFLISY